jgi:hypothetical protein
LRVMLLQVTRRAFRGVAFPACAPTGFEDCIASYPEWRIAVGGSVTYFAVRRETHGRSAYGVRREKAALFSGCKSHPATAPAGSNRSSHGGNEVAEAFG